MDTKSKWDNLSMKDKANLIKIYVNNGITDISSIRKDYNSNNQDISFNDWKQKISKYKHLDIDNDSTYDNFNKFSEGGDTNNSIFNLEELANPNKVVRRSPPDKSIMMNEFRQYIKEKKARDRKFKGFGGGTTGGGGFGMKFTESDVEYLPQYIRNTPIELVEDFATAYKRAREAGLSEFTFNGKKYTTEYSTNPVYKKKEFQTIPLNIREILDYNKEPMSDSTKVELYLGQIPGVFQRDTTEYIYPENYLKENTKKQ